MSRPRKPFGANPPGRLFATMVKVLAAEMSDQGRLARGKRYWADDAVIDIVVGHGAVTAEVQGGRAEPYVVTLEASGGSGLPTKRELWVQCTCPDDTGTGLDACKHAVAAMFALSDEIAIEPELVDRWRASRRQVREPNPEPDEPLAPVIDLHSGRAVEATGDERDQEVDDEIDEPDDDVIERDAISMLLRAPAGAAPPTFPDPSPIDHGPIRDRLLAEVLGDAVDHLAIRWE